MRRIHFIPTEYLLDNILDKDFQDMLLPLNIFQIFFLMSKYIVMNNFITPKNKVAHFKSAIGAVLLILSCIFRYFYHKGAVEDVRSYTLHFVLYLDLILYSIICVSTHICTGIQSCNTVELIIKLQQVLNLVRIDKTLFLFKLKIGNWISVISIVCVFIIFLLTGVEQFDIISIMAHIVLTFGNLIYDLHIIELTRIVVFIENELAAWNENVQAYKKITNRSEEEIKNEVIFDAYSNIVKAFNLCNKVYQFSITHFGLQLFIYVLINLQMMLELAKLGDEALYFQTTAARILIAAWNLKNIVLLTLLSISCEGYYGCLRVAESLCAQIIADDQCAAIHKACKNVRRLNRASFQKMSAFGIFQLDAAFPLRMLNSLVAYTVVLLQFAFL